MAIDKISSLDSGYAAGDLSLFPAGIDSFDTLYEAHNNAETVLVQGMSYTNKFVIAEDASLFPEKGLIKIGEEIIYYDSRTSTVFKDLKRGFARSKQTPHATGDKILGSVMAEHHNSIRDALIKIQTNLGVSEEPTTSSLNGILSDLETRFLTPKPKFRAFPLKGAGPLKVRFQNFSDGQVIQNFWDFGDGTTSREVNPIHTYQKDGFYSVKLSIVTSLGAHGIVTKTDYITVDANEQLAFFYADSVLGQSIDTAGSNATEFTLIDQSEGTISSRFWSFDDGLSETVDDPDIHDIQHEYQSPGEYEPSLFVFYDDGHLKKITLGQKITVL